MENTIEITYQIKKEFCHCCDRPFEVVESHEETIDIDVEDCLQQCLGDEVEVIAEDLIEFVRSYLGNTLNELTHYGSCAYVSKTESDKVLKAAWQFVKANDEYKLYGESVLEKRFAKKRIQSTGKITIDFKNIVEELESQQLKLCFVKDRSLFIENVQGHLYLIEPYYSGSYLDGLIKWGSVVDFNHLHNSSVSVPKEWQKKLWGPSEVKSFIERLSL